LARFGPAKGDYSTYADLVAATLPAGTWATCLAYGLVRFGAPPAGQVSFLLQGDSAGAEGWVRRPGRIIRRLATIAGGAGRTDDASLNALDAARPYNLSIYLDQQTTAREVIQSIAASLNCVAGVSWTGQLFIAPVAIGPADVVLAADGSSLPPVQSVQQLEIAAPFQKLALGAERAWMVHALDEIAFTATLVDVGTYDSATTYREGNVVTVASGARYLYIGAAPSAGNAPPSAAFWSQLAAAAIVDYANVTGATRPEDNATLGATLGANGAAGNVKKRVGGLWLESDLQTVVGISAGFNGQGPFSTIPSVGYGSSLLTGFNVFATLASIAFGSSYLLTSSGTAATDALYQTGLGIASGFFGQGALATLNAADYATRVTGAGKPELYATRGDNLVPDPLMAAGAARYAGSGWTFTARANAGDPGQGYATFASGVGGILGVNELQPLALTVGADRRVHFSAMVYHDNTVAGYGAANLECFTASGVSMGNVSAPLIPKVAGQWTAVATWVTVPAGTASVKAFFDRRTTNAGGATTGISVTAIRIATTELAATLGADIALNTFDGGALVARSALLTALGVASGFAGQGAFATVNSAAYGSALLTGFGALAPLASVAFGSSYLRTGTGAAATDALYQTSLGIASGIASQGAFATVSSAAYGSSLLTGFGALAPLASVAFGSSYLKTSTGTAATDALYQTGLGIASGYSGQGPWGTYSATPPAKLEGIADGAGASLPGLVDTSSVYTIKGNSVVKNATGWTGTVFCPLPLIGAARVSFRAVFAAGVSSYNVGFAVDPTIGQTAGWAGSGIWGVGVSTDASANYYLVNASGQFSNTSTPYQTGDVVTLDYQGASIVISRTTAAGVTTTIGTWTVDLGARFYCKAKLYSSGDALKEILVSNQNDPADVARNVRDGAALLPRTALITSLGTASGIFGQGAFATKSQAVYGSDITGFPYPLNPANMTMADTALRLRADAMVYGNGAYVQNLQPMELGSNKTETRIASGFNGQGALATQNAADWTGGVTGKPLALASGIDPSGKMDSAYIGYGFSSTSVRLSDYWPAELGSNKTETRIASAVSGQGPFATQAGGVSLDNRTLFSMPSRLSGLSNGDPGALPGGNIIFEPGQGFGDYRYLSELRPEEARGNRTETRTATGIAGQGIWATAGQIGRTQTQGATSYFAANAFSLNYTITRSDGTSTLTEALAVTGIGIAAGFQGQAALATMNQVDTPQIAPGSVSGFQSVDLGIGSIGAGEAAISEQLVTYTTTGGRLRVEISADTERSGTGTNAASIQLSALRADGSEILIGRSVKCQAVVDGPPVYYVAYVTFPAGTYRFRLRLNVSSGKGSNTWSIPAGTLGVEETKR
jgi:hypothetical protein